MQGDKVVSGINDVKLEILMSDITDYADKLNKIFNEANKIVEQTSIYFDCESGMAFREKYNTLSENHQTINSNILSYAKELLAVKDRYKKGMGEISDMVNSYSVGKREE